MKAAVFKAVGRVEVEDYPEPVCAPDQIKVKVAFCGICGTDMEILEDEFGLERGAPFPRILGHEASGTIVEVGSATRLGYKVGQRVAMVPVAPCGVCYFCRNGQEQFCQSGTLYSGAFAEYGVYGEGQVFPLADDVTFEVGTLLEPVGIAIRANELGHVGLARSVAIIGAGPIGCLILMTARQAGAIQTLVSEPVEYKREMARELGAAVTVDPFNEDLEAVARESTGGLGFDTVIDCTGKVAGAAQAVRLAGPGARVIWSAVYSPEGEVPVNANDMYEKDLTIRAVNQSPYMMPRASKMLSAVDFSPVISHIYDLDDINKAFDDQKHGRVMKALVRP